MNVLFLLMVTVAVAQDVSTAPAPGDGVFVAGDAPKPKLARPIKARIPKRAKDWEPIALKEGGDPYQASTGVTLKQVKTAKGGVKGERSKAKVIARSYPINTGEAWLIVSVYPKALEKRRKHFEIRLRVAEGHVEQVEVALITLTDKRAYKELDKPALRRLGVSFEEENPGSGSVSFSALDPKAGKTSWNAGRLSGAAFADADAGYADVSWSSKGVATP